MRHGSRIPSPGLTESTHPIKSNHRGIELYLLFSLLKMLVLCQFRPRNDLVDGYPI
jgi:hypothetical protein